jgi:hypothetical protein
MISEVRQTFRFETTGSRYQVMVTLASTGSTAGSRSLKPVSRWIRETLDHQDLDVDLRSWWVRIGLPQSTAPTNENLARLIYLLIAQSWIEDLPTQVSGALEAVRVSRTETSSAEYRKILKG